MNKFPNLPFVQLMPFAEIEDKRNVLLVTSAPAWNAVKDTLRGLNITASLQGSRFIQILIYYQKCEIISNKRT